MATSLETTINDLPDAILSTIIATITDVRSRNSASLVCRKWRVHERATRVALTLRGNIRDLFMLPNCFTSVTHLDLSLISPWGHPLLSPRTAPSATDDQELDPDSTLIAHLLRFAFPAVTTLSLYARDAHALRFLPGQWPGLKHLKLVRWHQRPQMESGEEINHLLRGVPRLGSLDLSNFYCWTEDIPPALESNLVVSRNLISLVLLNSTFSEGFKSDEIRTITSCCPSLKELKVACMFDPRYIGFVGDEALVSVATNCPKLSVLHLADTSVLSECRGGDRGDDGESAPDDPSFSVSTLIEVFSGLPLLEELVLDVCNNVRDSGPALEILHTKCPKLRSLKLGRFQGVSMPVESKLDGVALCERLQSLSIRDVGDLDDMGLIAIGRGCTRLTKFEVQSCKKITTRGMRTLASLLWKSLVDVRISCCKNLGACSSLKALEPIQERIVRLHIDCVWDSVEEITNLDGGVEYGFDLNTANGGGEASSAFESLNEDAVFRGNKKRKHEYDLNNIYEEDNGNGNGLGGRKWDRLQYLSLWIGVGELLAPLADAGLQECPNLEEIKIRVEGDSRLWSKPSQRAFGLSTLLRYPKLVKMHLDCGDIIGYAHTAPSGQMDLSLWERFYLLGIRQLSLKELDYWPPQDRDVNQRSLSLPSAGLLQECVTLRKLFIHGTAHEHFMMFLLRIPNLRDVQLREDYYPAPENDMSTEMRADSLSRFEVALNRRHICD